ncbi:hypothetical protein GCM10010218_45780 [Streptomyces mashuensis]|uniref:Uncharacterized protein n=1 Tax=Streptomyces mashuensis TaxID=33904 RepID=A0A919B711_9ACTN|nr:hypothetical protein GCM10010218_45780 [Streptomyces mashuensis]
MREGRATLRMVASMATSSRLAQSTASIVHRPRRGTGGGAAGVASLMPVTIGGPWG